MPTSIDPDDFASAEGIRELYTLVSRTLTSDAEAGLSICRDLLHSSPGFPEAKLAIRQLAAFALCMSSGSSGYQILATVASSNAKIGSRAAVIQALWDVSQGIAPRTSFLNEEVHSQLPRPEQVAAARNTLSDLIIDSLTDEDLMEAIL